MRYHTILFDADGTLLDFKNAEETALKKTFADHGFPFDEQTNHLYQQINHGLWGQFERGEIEKSVISTTRFTRLFQALGIAADGVAFNTEYLYNLGDGSKVLPGAKELCAALAPHCRLYIVTNGISKTQYRRLGGSVIQPYMSDIFVSEDTGSQKPLKAYFDYVFERIPGLDLKKTVIVGDSLTSDIQGGINAGIDTCWYNPSHAENAEQIPVTWEIDDLLDFIEIAEGKRGRNLAASMQPQQPCMVE